MNPRTCVGCRAKDEAKNMVRLVLRDHHVLADTRRHMPGRGAWIHGSATCISRALRSGALPRAFRSRVDATPFTATIITNGQ
ncbi:YlxR family protein [Actinobaculum suis]